MEISIEDRINRLLNRMEDPSASKNEVEAIQGKIDYLRTLQD